MQTRFSSGRFTRRLASALCASAMLCSLSSCSMPRLAGRAEAEAQMSPCEKAMMLADYATHPAEGTPLLEQYATGLAAPLAWIDVAGYCSGRFAEGTLRDAQTKQWLTFLADKFGQSAPEVTPARLDGVTSANVDRSVLDAMAVAEDRAGFAIEVLAARGQTAGATLALSDMHKTAGQQLVSLANGNFDDSGAQSSSSGQSDPRQKVYAIDQLLANPTTIADKASGQTVPTVAAIEMDCARAQIKAVTESKSSTESDTLLILAALAAKHAYTAFQLGYPATDAALFE